MIDSVFHDANIDTYFINKNINTRIIPENNGHNLYHNMKKYKTMLFVPSIGHSYKSLVKLCSKIDINNYTTNGKIKSYDALVREYLIKVKVGY